MCSDPVTAGVNDEQRGRILALALDYMKATQRRRRDGQTDQAPGPSPVVPDAHCPGGLEVSCTKNRSFVQRDQDAALFGVMLSIAALCLLVLCSGCTTLPRKEVAHARTGETPEAVRRGAALNTQR